MKSKSCRPSSAESQSYLRQRVGHRWPGWPLLLPGSRCFTAWSHVSCWVPACLVLLWLGRLCLTSRFYQKLYPRLTGILQPILDPPRSCCLLLPSWIIPTVLTPSQRGHIPILGCSLPLSHCHLVALQSSVPWVVKRLLLWRICPYM